MRTIFCVMYNLKLPKARRSASLVAHQHFGSAVSRTAQLLVLILDSARTKCYATCSVSYRYFMHKYLFVPRSRYVSQSRTYQHQRRFSVRKSSHHSRPSSYLAIHSLYHVIRTYFQPMLRGEFHIRQRLFYRFFYLFRNM